MMGEAPTSGLYWLTQALTAFPLALWVYLGVGIGWALVALPRDDWRDRPLVLLLSFVFGPAALTAYLFVLGTFGGAWEVALLRFDLAFAGSAVIAVAGWWLAWRKTGPHPTEPTALGEGGKHRWRDDKKPLALGRGVWGEGLQFDEKLLIALILVALVLRWLVTAFWPFTAYDPLWVFGFQGRLYTLLGHIPPSIDYYPQFVPLQYAFGQLAVGDIADRAARAFVPFMHWGSILAAYVLGARLFARRTGLFLAAIWTLYPHVGDWAHVGDLEIPVTFLFTATAAFFLMAWTSERPGYRRRYALIAGLIFGVAMWTKPTAGGFVWGVVLLVALEFLRVGGDWRRWWPRFEVAAITGLACIPLGAVWYARNVLLGHNAIDLPPSVWLTLARRSGDHFGWWLLALTLLVSGLLAWRRQQTHFLVPGIVLVWAALLPSMPWIDPTRFDPPGSRLTLVESFIALIGAILLVMGLGRYQRDHLHEHGALIGRVMWATLLALPYFATYFISYSYHYRLGFAIVPLMILPTAVVLALWLTPERLAGWRWPSRWLYGGLIIALALPGVLSATVDNAGQAGWFWSDRYPDDRARYATANPSLVLIADALNAYQRTMNDDDDLVVVAPGEQRLPFFYPDQTIINDVLPTRLDELSELGATHYIYGTQARWRYEDAQIPVSENQVVASLGRARIMPRVLMHDDATFSYELYALHLERRWQQGDFILGPREASLIFGDAVRFVGDNLVSLNFYHNNPIHFDFMLEVLQPLPPGTRFQMTLYHPERDETVYTWETPLASTRHGAYWPHLWQPGEFIAESRVYRLTQDELDPIPPGTGYVMRYQLLAPDGEPLTVYRDGEPMGAGIATVLDYNVIHTDP